jgi:hypothetical protein
VTYKGEKGNAYRNLVGKPEGKKPLEVLEIDVSLMALTYRIGRRGTD